MATSDISSSVFKTKFRGCMLGGLLGDCLGAPFQVEAHFRASKSSLRDFLTNVMDEEYVRMLYHTDDTRMTLCIASSLTDKGEFNARDIAERFVDEFYSQPDRGYGTNVRYVFAGLKESKFEDIFLPAKTQFNGSGSYGNGGAMRTAPIALFGNSRGEDYLMNAAKECALITHAHPNGYNGAILQCLAVNIALKLDPLKELDPVFFIDTLLEKMENIENEDALFFKLQRFFKYKSTKNKDLEPYVASLNTMKEIFLQGKDPSSEEIADCLGNARDASALKSVPPAIYSFLRGMKPFEDYLENPNPFVRTVFFAISLGGDTDTIASMAGSIAGAYYGANMIPEVLQKRCEGIDEIISLADKLFDVTYKKE